MQGELRTMSKMESKIIQIILCVYALLSSGTCFIVQLSGRNIAPQEATTGDNSDPFAKIFIGGSCQGRTQTIDNNQNPDWNCDFSIGSSNSLLRIEVTDHDGGSGGDDIIGNAEVYADVIRQMGTYCVPIWYNSNMYMGEVCIRTTSMRTTGSNDTTLASCCSSCNSACSM